MLYPRCCYGCGRPGQYFCPKCCSQLIYCPIKPNYPKAFDGTLSIFPYNSSIKSAINDLKFKFVSELVSELTTQMSVAIKKEYSHLLEYWQQSAFTLIPIPLHPTRYLWRGFNQSELICRHLSTMLKLDTSPDILLRSKNTQPQAQIKDKSIRHQNIQSAFYLNPKITPPSKIILVDDVVTTGSTLSSSFSVFPKNTEAWALTIAG